MFYRSFIERLKQNCDSYVRSGIKVRFYFEVSFHHYVHLCRFVKDDVPVILIAVLLFIIPAKPFRLCRSSEGLHTIIHFLMVATIIVIQ